MATDTNHSGRRIPNVLLAVAILAVILGVFVTQPVLIGGFQLGLFITWIALLAIPLIVVGYQLTGTGGDR